MIKILVLYAEIMPYNTICFKSLLSYSDVEIHAVSWGKEKKLTPYEPPAIQGIIHYEKGRYDKTKILSLIDKLMPSCLYVSGRMEDDYLSASLYARKKRIPVIGTSDNQYTGSLKQVISSLLTGVLYKRYFDYLMVPGLYQYEYARFLGFKREQILFPQYCADNSLFHEYYKNKRKINGSNNILFLGRLNKVKGIHLLIQAFIELHKEHQLDTKLILVGNGPEKSAIPQHDHIIMHDFLEQKDLLKILPGVRFFCLPSLHEPWGVVIHEMCAAGIPIITTRIAGAGTAFVKNYYNGLIISENNIPALKAAIMYLIQTNDDEIEQMGKRCYELSFQITPQIWATTIMSVINQTNHRLNN